MQRVLSMQARIPSRVFLLLLLLLLGATPKARAEYGGYGGGGYPYGGYGAYGQYPMAPPPAQQQQQGGGGGGGGGGSTQYKSRTDPNEIKETGEKMREDLASQNKEFLENEGKRSAEALKSLTEMKVETPKVWDEIKDGRKEISEIVDEDGFRKAAEAALKDYTKATEAGIKAIDARKNAGVAAIEASNREPAAEPPSVTQILTGQRAPVEPTKTTKNEEGAGKVKVEEHQSSQPEAGRNLSGMDTRGRGAVYNFQPGLIHNMPESFGE